LIFDLFLLSCALKVKTPVSSSFLENNLKYYFAFRERGVVASSAAWGWLSFGGRDFSHYFDFFSFIERILAVEWFANWVAGVDGKESGD